MTARKGPIRFTGQNRRLIIYWIRDTDYWLSWVLTLCLFPVFASLCLLAYRMDEWNPNP